MDLGVHAKHKCNPMDIVDNNVNQWHLMQSLICRISQAQEMANLMEQQGSSKVIYLILLAVYEDLASGWSERV